MHAENETVIRYLPAIPGSKKEECPACCRPESGIYNFRRACCRARFLLGLPPEFGDAAVQGYVEVWRRIYGEYAVTETIAAY
ncbi:MAG: hypothetical protein M0Z36_07250 [Thermaerobacter sp.]|nr:hypothetical protein [Thermaerobacter sp.]